MTGENSESDTDHVTPSLPYGPFAPLYCRLHGHDYVDDAFMGSGQRCTQCGRWDESPPLTAADGVFIGVAIGVLVGIGIGVLLTF
ncbi:hypothetical protein [Halostella litorea]|uniref:hypothetical protein n=1 Tax=Halostella litorea TaxID=2528831 RepID=UPI0010918F1B|nr:hypothetical protein [Halostella litorea]